MDTDGSRSSKWGYVTWTVKLFRVFEFFILIFVSFLFWIDFIFEVSFLEISDLRGEIFDPREVCNEIYRVLWILRIFKFEKIFSSTKLKFFFLFLFIAISMYTLHFKTFKTASLIISNIKFSFQIMLIINDLIKIQYNWFN